MTFRIPHRRQNLTKKTQTTIAVELSRHRLSSNCRRLSSTATLQLAVANKHSKSHSKSPTTPTHTNTHSKSHRRPFAALRLPSDPSHSSQSPKPSLTVLTLLSLIHLTSPSPIHFAHDGSLASVFCRPFARFSPSLTVHTIYDASSDALVLSAMLQSIHWFFFFFN